MDDLKTAQPTASADQPLDSWKAGTKFGVLALDDCLHVKLAETCKVSERVSVRPIPVARMPSHWREWLGTLMTGHLENANLSIVVEMHSATPEVLDQETLDIDLELTAHFYALLLQGIPDYREGIVALGGVKDSGEMTVRRVRRVPTAYRHAFGKRPAIVTDVVERAHRIANNLLALHKQSSFRRVRAGFKACVRGIEEPLPEERLHQYVRAVDGLMMLPKGPGVTHFVNRGSTFAKGAALDATLNELYRLRNAQEHLNDFRSAVTATNEKEFNRIVSLRAYQAEQLALSCYTRLLDTNGLLSHFESEDKIAAFWGLDLDQRRAILGEPFDLDQTEMDHDYGFNLLYDQV